MSKCDGQEIWMSRRINFAKCRPMASGTQLNSGALRNIEKRARCLTFNPSSTWDFQFNHRIWRGAQQNNLS
jgi:hypothetical protein